MALKARVGIELIEVVRSDQQSFSVFCVSDRSSNSREPMKRWKLSKLRVVGAQLRQKKKRVHTKRSALFPQALLLIIINAPSYPWEN